jgi:phospholipase/carboxylesterase
MKHTFTRRRFTAMTGAFASLAFSGFAEAVEANDGRLTVRPPSKVTTSAKGEFALGLERERDAYLRLPPNATDAPLPLFVMLHGAGGSGAGVIRRVADAADEAGVAVLAPESRDRRWDAIRGRFGADIAFMNRALERTFETVSVDPRRLAIGGFSDGATYALSVGLINGDLFRRVVAFSPGFVVRGTAHGKPRIFVSHGTADPVFPIDECSGIIVPVLLARGYDVNFKEFEGGHTIPAGIATEAMRWLAAT